MANQQPDVSIVIAAYNVEPYIKRAIQSALDQKGVTIEVIVIDDCSSDKTIEAASQIIDERLTILRRAQNGGAGAARNDGIAAAKGKWIAILDGDDVFLPDRLNRCLRMPKNNSADIVVDNLAVKQESDGQQYNMYEASDFGNSNTLDLATFIRGNTSFLGGKALGYLKPIFSSAFLQKNNLKYDPSIRIGEDYMLLAEALASGAKCSVDFNARYVYTVHKGSTSHRLTLIDVENMQNADKIFLSKHKLDRSAALAQAIRTEKLHQAELFTNLVTSIKTKDFIRSLLTIVSHPTLAILLLRIVRSKLLRLGSP